MRLHMLLCVRLRLCCNKLMSTEISMYSIVKPFIGPGVGQLKGSRDVNILSWGLFLATSAKYLWKICLAAYRSCPRCHVPPAGRACVPCCDRPASGPAGERKRIREKKRQLESWRRLTEGGAGVRLAKPGKETRKALQTALFALQEILTSKFWRRGSETMTVRDILLSR